MLSTSIYPTQAHSFTNDYGRSMIKSYRNIKSPSVTARRVSTLFVSSSGMLNAVMLVVVC